MVCGDVFAIRKTDKAMFSTQKPGMLQSSARRSQGTLASKKPQPKKDRRRAETAQRAQTSCRVVSTLDIR